MENCDLGGYGILKEEVTSAFNKGLYTEIVLLMDKHLGHHHYSLSSLFRDEQRKILKVIFEQSMQESLESYQSMFDRTRPLMEFVQDFGMPVPDLFTMASQPALTASLRKELTQEEIDTEAAQRIIDQIKKFNVPMETADNEYFLRRHAESLTRAFREDPDDLKLMAKVQKYMDLLNSIPVPIVLWQVQNDYYLLAKTVYPDYVAKSKGGDEGAGIWLEAFRKLGETFRFNLGAVLPQE